MPNDPLKRRFCIEGIFMICCALAMGIPLIILGIQQQQFGEIVVGLIAAGFLGYMGVGFTLACREDTSEPVPTITQGNDRLGPAQEEEASTEEEQASDWENGSSSSDG